MLADDVAALVTEEDRLSLEATARFVFEASAVDAIRTIDGMKFDKMKDFARLPYDKCWFEFLARDVLDDQTKWHTAKRFGFWVLTDGDFHRYRTFQSAPDGLVYHGEPFLARLRTEDAGIDIAAGDQQFDAAGWTSFLIYRCLVVLNTKNLIERKQVEHSNTRRMRNGKRPLLSYHICRINRDKSASTSMRIGEGGGVALHTVRGHYKLLRSGPTWWRPHFRGEFAPGSVVQKEYRV